MRPVCFYDHAAKSYSITVGQNMFMELLPLPIRVTYDLPVSIIDAAFHVHINWYLNNVPEQFIYHREQLTLGSILYTIQANKLIRFHRLPTENKELKFVQEVVEGVYSLFSCTMLVRAIDTNGTEVDIDTFLWDDDHDPTDDEMSFAFAGHDLISGCLERPVYEQRAFKRMFSNTSVKSRLAGTQKSSKNKGGRRSYAEDKWAWDEVNLKGRDRREVYREWLEKVKHSKRRVLADPERTFRHIAELTWRRKPEESSILRVYSGDSGVE